MAMNKVFLLGNAGVDAEVRFTQSGQAVANFSIATTEKWLDKSGQKQERTEWHRIVVWGKQAELCGELVKKGDKVFIEGRIQTKEWTDKEGQKRESKEINANWVEFLGGKRSGGAPAESAPPPPSEGTGPDDIPF